MLGSLLRCVCLLILAPACVFAHSRMDIERDLQLVSGLEIPTMGVSKVIERGPTVIPVLLEIVSGSRERALAWKGAQESGREGFVVRLRAIEALGFLMEGPTEAASIVPVLESVARDLTDRTSFRSAAVHSLALNGTDEGLDALERVFEQSQKSSDDLRLLVVGVFGSTPNDRGRAILSRLQAVDDPLTKSAVSSALKFPPTNRYVPKRSVVTKNAPSCSASGAGEAAVTLVLLLLWVASRTPSRTKSGN